MRSCLVLEGGALRGIYTAGVIDYLLENNFNFDTVIGVSAGALFGCNYISKQNLQNQNNPIIDNINSNNNRIINHYHGAGYERHYGIVENCPVCRSMQKKSEYMEEIIFGESRKKLNLKPTIKKEDFNPNSDQNEFKI